MKYLIRLIFARHWLLAIFVGVANESNMTKSVESYEINLTGMGLDDCSIVRPSSARFGRRMTSTSFLDSAGSSALLRRRRGWLNS